MNEIKVWNYESSEVRTIEKDGEPWWILADVCKVLELSNPTMVAKKLDSDERAKLDLGRQGETTIINESGLYTVILRSDKPQAKPFRKWVTSEVLPSIRKTGSYCAIQNLDSYMIEDPIVRAERWVEEYKEKQRLQITVAEQEEEIKKQEELKKLDEPCIPYNGKLYTEYEISQMQRAGERKVRAWKRRCITAQEVERLL